MTISDVTSPLLEAAAFSIMPAEGLSKTASLLLFLIEEALFGYFQISTSSSARPNHYAVPKGYFLNPLLKFLIILSFVLYFTWGAN